MHHKVVTEQALVKRINRALATEGRKIRKSRPQRGYCELGEYFEVDVNRNFVTSMHVDIEAWGRELEVLKPGESVQTVD